jgi:hypothetical protein
METCDAEKSTIATKLATLAFVSLLPHLTLGAFAIYIHSFIVPLQRTRGLHCRSFNSSILADCLSKDDGRKRAFARGARYGATTYRPWKPNQRVQGCWKAKGGMGSHSESNAGPQGE